jgi:CDP-diacylglycerol--glycerol-3-phosphate 3-phosphatidyltransferase
MIRFANERIAISSLYLGTGKMEEFIVEELIKALKRKPNIKLTILLDYNRAMRIENNQQTANMLNKILKFVNKINNIRHIRRASTSGSLIL